MSTTLEQGILNLAAGIGQDVKLLTSLINTEIVDRNQQVQIVAASAALDAGDKAYAAQAAAIAASAPSAHVGSGDGAHALATSTSAGFMSPTDKANLDAISSSNVSSVNSKTGVVVLTKTDIGLSNVDNTADASKVVLSASKLTTPVTINGTQFDGSQAIVVTATDSVARIAATEKGAPNGVATLGADGTLTLNQIPASIIGGMKFGSIWDPATNTPDLTTTTSPFRTDGTVIKVNIVTTTAPGPVTFTDLNGFSDWNNGDMAVFGQGVWSRFEGSDSEVLSVSGRVGHVTLDASDVGLGKVDNTRDLLKPLSDATVLALAEKENTIVAGTTDQYFRGDKTWATIAVATPSTDGFMSAADKAQLDTLVMGSGGLITSVNGHTAGIQGDVHVTKDDVGLGNVDNTSDDNKNVFSATVLTTARNIAGVAFDGSANIDIPFSNLTDKPTTLAGYGITEIGNTSADFVAVYNANKAPDVVIVPPITT